MESLETFVIALTTLSKTDLVETAREQANSLVKHGNPYFAAMIRELANRLERS